MRRWGLAALCALALVAPSMAAAEAGSTLADFQYTREVLAKRIQDFGSPNSPFSQLSKATRAWVREEAKRQGQTPRSTTEVLMDVDRTVAEDAQELSRRHDIDPMDITRVVTLFVMVEAEDAAAKAVRKAKKAGDAAAVATAKQQLADAVQRRKEAYALQSQVSLALAMM